MDRPHVVVGFIPGGSDRTESTRQIAATRKVISARAGASTGRGIVALYIIERVTGQPASLGARARSWSGGTRPRANGRESIIPIFRSTNPRTLSRPAAKADWMEFPATPLSFYTKTD